MCARVRVCMYAFGCVYVCMSMYVRASSGVCACVCMCVHVCACASLSLFPSLPPPCAHRYLDAHRERAHARERKRERRRVFWLVVTARSPMMNDYLLLFKPSLASDDISITKIAEGSCT